MEDTMAECCEWILGRILLSAYIYLIEKQIVSRRAFITKHGRLLQDYLQIPVCLWVFSKEDPGMADDELRVSAVLLGISFLMAGLALGAVMPMKGTFWDPWVIGLGIVNPIGVVVLCWFGLVLAKRQRLSWVRRHGYNPPEESLEQSIQGVWVYY